MRSQIGADAICFRTTLVTTDLWHPCRRATAVRLYPRSRRSRLMVGAGKLLTWPRENATVVVVLGSSTVVETIGIVPMVSPKGHRSQV